MNRRTIILLGFIILKFLLQYFFINSYYDLQRDEYLHLDQANHLALGYLSIPPVTSWVSYIIQAMGNSLFWVKFFPALFGALTIFIVWKTIEELKGNLYALVLGATCLLLSVLVRLNSLFQPNSIDVLCWTAFCFTLIKYFNKEQVKWLYMAAVVFAFGFLNKYNIVFLLMGIIPAILLIHNRKVFQDKNLYLAILLALVLISPNLYWQYINGFPVFHHLRELTDTQLVNLSRFSFLKEQIFYFIGSLPVIFIALYALLSYPPFKKYRFFFWTFIFTLAVFIYFRAKGYYAIGLYPVYIGIGSVFLGEVLQSDWKKYLQPVILALPVLFYVLLFHVVFSTESPIAILKRQKLYQKLGLLHWEDGKDHPLPQDFADMLGWHELAAKVETAYHKMPKGSNTIILCDNYGQAGAINYYVKDKHMKAVSFNTDYINWFNLEQKTDNLIRVKEFDADNAELEKTSPYFHQSYIADQIQNPSAREYGTTIFVFVNAKIDIHPRLKSEIKEELRKISPKMRPQY